CDRRTPIYGMTDAIAGNSGPSFGAHQLDIASNCRAQDAIRHIAASTQPLLAGERTLYQRLRDGYFHYPVRDYKIVKLRNFYTSVPKMNVIVSSPPGRQRADDEFARFFDDRIAKFEALQRSGGLPSQRLWVNLYISDVSHQYGGSS